jgi:peptidoglycan hydrolase-like protein with peptidoglycan-binding domain
VLALVLGLAAAAVLIASARATLSGDGAALARIGLPLGGGRVERLLAVTGPHSRRIPVQLRGGRIWPRGRIPAGTAVRIDVVIRRPGWIAWLAGHAQRLHLSLLTPVARLTRDYLTLPAGAPLTVRFSQPVRAIAYGESPGHLRRRELGSPRSVVALRRTAVAGSVWVAGMPRDWETARPEELSWFPAGAATAAVATPAPGSTIGPTTPITLSFARPVAQALRGSMPPVSPAAAGRWHLIDSHTIVFRPEGYGYGLGVQVTVGLPAGVRLMGGRAGGSADGGGWNVPAGTTIRLQQLLAMLGYLPLSFSYSGPRPASTPSAQEAAAIHPPEGSFSWRWGDIPPALRSLWSPGADGVMTRGAVMAFENDHGLAPDGVAGPQVWRALIAAALSGRGSSFGYSFVTVDKASQQLTLWHDGRTILTTPVNTGIAQAPTASGTFPVYEHIRVGTMSGTNPDGSHYDDPGIQFISYFNGGDALHAFTRAQYGFPQSLGCVEMALGPAGEVWPYTPVGTLVHVA